MKKEFKDKEDHDNSVKAEKVKEEAEKRIKADTERIVNRRLAGPAR